jgi:acetyl-CoA synthetase
LSADAVNWAQQTWRRPVLDNWWQTETGGIMISNFVSEAVRPGSMGRPMPGVEAALVERGDDGHVRRVNVPNVRGEIAFRAGWPSMFRAYYHDPERYARCFVDGWYLSGDIATCDSDGYYWFIGRADDVIKSAGHLIGPFEVESVLTAHPAVAEAAVIGRPDPILGETVKAFIVLRDDFSRDAGMEDALLAHARRHLGAQVAPREIAFVDELPHTRSGKVMRRLLRARELGLPEGDLSTLEGQADSESKQSR